MHREPAPADYESGEGEVRPRRGAAAQRAYAASELEEARQQRPGRRELEPGREREPAREAREYPRRLQRRDEGGEDDDEAADVQYIPTEAVTERAKAPGRGRGTSGRVDITLRPRPRMTSPALRAARTCAA